MADDERRIAEAKRAKQAEIDRKRAEVRKRMEEASKAKKAKKGFMTPDRKKKLRLLLRKKAAEELKKEQERKAAERRRIIEERCGTPKNIDDANEDDLAELCTELWNRVYQLEGEKFDLEREFRMKAWEISDLNSQVNDLRGKFVKPTLKKVSKYENKFAKLQKKAAEFNFRNQLKVVKKKEFTLEEEDKEKKPDWSKQKDDKKEEGEEEHDTESVITEGDTTAPGSEAGILTDDAQSEATRSEAATPEPDVILEPEPVEEPQPPSPAPEELWEYLKDAVTHDAVISVDQLVEKLVTTVSSIPQPYLKSVVKESIKKQKSIEEEETASHAGEGENAGVEKAPEDASPTEGNTENAAARAEGAPAEATPTENPETPAQPPSSDAPPQSEPSPAEPAPEVVEAAA